MSSDVPGPASGPRPAFTAAPAGAGLDGYPALAARDTPATLWRIVHRRSRTAGALNPPWRFSSAPPGASRFDLPEPGGTCCWSDRRYGSWVEVWRGARVVDRAEVTRRALSGAAPPVPGLADTLVLAAHRFGGTGGLCALVPYDLPQPWARALRAQGCDGLVGRCRHDPLLTARTVAVFGPGGVTARRAGWTTRRSALLADPQLAAELAGREVQVAAAPQVVPISVP